MSHFHPSMGPLHVIAVITNPLRFDSRYRLFKEFADRIKKNANAVLHVVECAYGERPHVLHGHGHHHHTYKTHEELWLKENLINIGFSKLPADWKYAAWVDADIEFSRPDWAEETIQQLQHYKIVQMWSHATDLGPHHQHMHHHCSYIYTWHHDPKCLPQYGFGRHHPGYAWAIRRDAADCLPGPLIDYAILGSGDLHMAGAFTGVVERTFHKGTSQDYKDALLHYQRLCDKNIRHKVGYVPMSLIHHWHGKKKDRGYTSRWKILSDNDYSPYKDIIRRSDGLIALTSEKQELRDGIMRYFRSRNEDSIDTE